jgi:hypothetical protein
VCVQGRKAEAAADTKVGNMLHGGCMLRPAAAQDSVNQHYMSTTTAIVCYNAATGMLSAVYANCKALCAAKGFDKQGLIPLREAMRSEDKAYCGSLLMLLDTEDENDKEALRGALIKLGGAERACVPWQQAAPEGMQVCCYAPSTDTTLAWGLRTRRTPDALLAE